MLARTRRGGLLLPRASAAAPVLPMSRPPATVAARRIHTTKFLSETVHRHEGKFVMPHKHPKKRIGAGVGGAKAPPGMLGAPQKVPRPNRLSGTSPCWRPSEVRAPVVAQRSGPGAGSLRSNSLPGRTSGGF